MDRERVIRVAAGTVLLGQRRAAAAIHKTIHAEASRVASDVEAKQNGTAKAALLALLLLGSRSMAAALVVPIFAARSDARSDAHRRLAAELKVAGILIEAHQWALGRRETEDQLHAEAAAQSLAGQWRGMALAGVLSAQRRETPPVAAIHASAARMRSRVERTAASEVSQAYNDEHLAASKELVEQDERFRDGAWSSSLREGAVDVWSAMLDACERCWPHDGEEVPVGESFSGGDEPGHMHPRCQCLRVTVAA